MRPIHVTLALLLSALPCFAQDKVVLVIHGGAGAIAKKKMTPELEKQFRQALELALKTGHQALGKGGSLDAVEAAINVMEDSGTFNAGKGAVFNRDGRQELNASIMDGKSRNAGAVAGLSRIKNPITAARAIMEKSEHVFMIGAGAERFCRDNGVKMVSPLYFWTERSWKDLQEADEAANKKAGAQAPNNAAHFGTVGAVALDAKGNLAAGTSTGGITYVRAGRVGDSPIIGAGAYAENETCAVSCTGKGELFIRFNVASDIAARMKYRGDSLKKAATEVLAGLPKIPGGAGGLIALDRQGNVALPFSTNGMYRGTITQSGKIWIAIYEDAAQTEKTAWWSADVEQAWKRAGDRRAELEKALHDVPPSQRSAMAFLIANMPDRDLRSLRADFLLENVALAYKVRDEVKWGRAIPEDIFLNDVLAYANLDETREPWRKQMIELCFPLVKDCKTPTEAAQKLNATIFTKLKVRYSTERKKANQSPKESIDQGLASCSGLSVLLSDACRSVCVPARLAGTPNWFNDRGNHTWVEIWDGRWYFTGAAEYDAKGLDRAWFAGDAAKATKADAEHAIYAASFRRTKIHFPLVWNRDSREVSAENVTDRYTRPPPLPAGEGPGVRVAKLPKELVAQIDKEATAFFEADAEKRAQWKFDAKLDRLLLDNEGSVRESVWKAYRESGLQAETRKDFQANQVRYKTHVSPYVVRKVGKKPEGGWPLFIAMHGGGGAPKAVNDSQWQHMQIYYRDHPGDAGYLYLALRAPNDTWNGFYDGYVPPLVINLIRQHVALGDVDPDKVFLMGYSHGGYGAFYIGPKIPDRFAAIHASAAAPTDGTISARTLRNTRFTFMIGEKDTAYGRAERCQKFNALVEKLQKENPGEFPVKMEWIAKAGHGGLPDRDKIKDLIAHRREAMPRHLSWDLTDGFIDSFYWLSVAKPGAGQAIDAKLTGNAVAITTRDVNEFSLELDARLVRYDQPLTITLNGKAREVTLRPSLRTLCESLLERGDPRLAHSCKIALK